MSASESTTSTTTPTPNGPAANCVLDADKVRSALETARMCTNSIRQMQQQRLTLTNTLLIKRADQRISASQNERLAEMASIRRPVDSGLVERERVMAQAISINDQIRQLWRTTPGRATDSNIRAGIYARVDALSAERQQLMASIGEEDAMVWLPDFVPLHRRMAENSAAEADEQVATTTNNNDNTAPASAVVRVVEDVESPQIDVRVPSTDVDDGDDLDSLFGGDDSAEESEAQVGVNPGVDLASGSSGDSGDNQPSSSDVQAGGIPAAASEVENAPAAMAAGAASSDEVSSGGAASAAMARGGGRVVVATSTDVAVTISNGPDGAPGEALPVNSNNNNNSSEQEEAFQGILEDASWFPEVGEDFVAPLTPSALPEGAAPLTDEEARRILADNSWFPGAGAMGGNELDLAPVLAPADLPPMPSSSSLSFPVGEPAVQQPQPMSLPRVRPSQPSGTTQEDVVPATRPPPIPVAPEASTSSNNLQPAAGTVPAPTKSSAARPKPIPKPKPARLRAAASASSQQPSSQAAYQHQQQPIQNVLASSSQPAAAIAAVEAVVLPPASGNFSPRTAIAQLQNAWITSSPNNNNSAAAANNDITNNVPAAPAPADVSAPALLPVRVGGDGSGSGSTGQDAVPNPTTTSSSLPSAQTQATPKRGRGRPRKDAATTAENGTPKRGRGRPRKDGSGGSPAGGSADSTAASKRRRGRPCKGGQSTTADPPAAAASTSEMSTAPTDNSFTTTLNSQPVVTGPSFAPFIAAQQQPFHAAPEVGSFTYYPQYFQDPNFAYAYPPAFIPNACCAGMSFAYPATPPVIEGGNNNYLVSDANNMNAAAMIYTPDPNARLGLNVSASDFVASQTQKKTSTTNKKKNSSTTQAREATQAVQQSMQVDQAPSFTTPAPDSQAAQSGAEQNYPLLPDTRHVTAPTAAAAAPIPAATPTAMQRNVHRGQTSSSTTPASDSQKARSGAEKNYPLLPDTQQLAASTAVAAPTAVAAATAVVPGRSSWRSHTQSSQRPPAPAPASAQMPVMPVNNNGGQDHAQQQLHQASQLMPPPPRPIHNAGNGGNMSRRAHSQQPQAAQAPQPTSRPRPRQAPEGNTIINNNNNNGPQSLELARHIFTRRHQQQENNGQNIPRPTAQRPSVDGIHQQQNSGQHIPRPAHPTAQRPEANNTLHNNNNAAAPTNKKRKASEPQQQQQEASARQKRQNTGSQQQRRATGHVHSMQDPARQEMSQEQQDQHVESGGGNDMLQDPRQHMPSRQRMPQHNMPQQTPPMPQQQLQELQEVQQFMNGTTARAQNARVPLNPEQPPRQTNTTAGPDQDDHGSNASEDSIDRSLRITRERMMLSDGLESAPDDFAANVNEIMSLIRSNVSIQSGAQQQLDEMQVMIMAGQTDGRLYEQFVESVDQIHDVVERHMELIGMAAQNLERIFANFQRNGPANSLGTNVVRNVDGEGDMARGYNNNNNNNNRNRNHQPQQYFNHNAYAGGENGSGGFNTRGPSNANSFHTYAPSGTHHMNHGENVARAQNNQPLPQQHFNNAYAGGHNGHVGFHNNTHAQPNAFYTNPSSNPAHGVRTNGPSSHAFINNNTMNGGNTARAQMMQAQGPQQLNHAYAGGVGGAAEYDLGLNSDLDDIAFQMPMQGHHN